MTISAFTGQILRHQVLVQRLSADEVNKFAPFLRQIDRTLRDALIELGVGTFAATRLGVLLSHVSGMITRIFDEYSAAVLRDLSLFARHEATFSGDVLSGAGTFEVIVPDYTQLRKVILDTPLGIRDSGRGALLRDFISTWTASEVRAIEGTIRRGVFEGKASSEIIAELHGTPERRYQDGLINVTRRHAEAVVRTAIQHVATVAREETYAANPGVIIGYSWLATLDKRTCPSCAALDDKQFKLGVGPRSPLHISCRCTMLPVLNVKYEYLDSGVYGADGSFYEWLKAQPAEFQDLAIGSTRGAQLRSGGLSASRFAALQIDKNFAPMTLDEMRGIEPTASRQAA